MLKRAILAALIILPHAACMTALEEGASEIKDTALHLKKEAVDLKDAALDAKDWAADYAGLPEPYHGRGQAVCGYLNYETGNHNIYPDVASLQDNSKGFGVMSGVAEHQMLLRHHGAYVCLSGEVFYRGCGKEITCETSDFLYTVRVDAIRGS